MVGAEEPTPLIGQVGVNPGAAWTGGGVSTLNQTLIRKCPVVFGDPDGTNPFDPSLEWVGLAQDTLDDLGTHACAP